jgi:arabinosaccharide transport system substrate-binding protein
MFDENNQPTLNEPLNARVIARLATWFVGPTHVAAEVTLGGASSMRLIREGYVVGMLAPDWYSGSIRANLPDMAGKFKVMPLPAWDKGGRRTSVLGGTMLGITKASRTPEAAWGFAKALYLSPVTAQRLYEEACIVTPAKANWSQPFYDVPDPYFCGQAIGRMYIELAPNVPLRPSSAYGAPASDLLNLAVIQLCKYAEEHRLYDARALEPEAQRLLDEAQRQLKAQINRNVFLRSAAR